MAIVLEHCGCTDASRCPHHVHPESVATIPVACENGEEKTGVFQKWEYTRSGVQITTIDGEKYATVFDLATPPPGASSWQEAIGKRIAFRVGPVNAWYGVPEATIDRVVSPSSASETAAASETPSRERIAEVANFAVKGSRRFCGPILTGKSSREEVLRWLQANDPNGSYLDEEKPTRAYLRKQWHMGDEEIDDFLATWTPDRDPLTKEEAWTALHEALSEDYSGELRNGVPSGASENPLCPSGSCAPHVAAEAPLPTICEPFIRVVKDVEKFRVCAAAAKEIGPLRTPEAIYLLVAPYLLEQDQEILLLVATDVRFNLRGVVELAKGQRSRVNVGVDDVLSAAVLTAVAETHGERLFIVHNHPSGDPSPSKDDKELTKTCRAAIEPLGEVVLVDHVVVGLDAYYSEEENRVRRVKSRARRRGR